MLAICLVSLPGGVGFSSFLSGLLGKEVSSHLVFLFTGKPNMRDVVANSSLLFAVEPSAFLRLPLPFVWRHCWAHENHGCPQLCPHPKVQSSLTVSKTSFFFFLPVLVVSSSPAYPRTVPFIAREAIVVLALVLMRREGLAERGRSPHCCSYWQTVVTFCMCAFSPVPSFFPCTSSLPLLLYLSR